MTQIIEKGFVVRGWLGIEAQDMTPQLAQSYGLTYTHGMLVGGVIRDGPASKAGLLPGDIVTTINDQAVGETSAAMKTISRQQPGTTITLTGVRKGIPFTAHVRVIQRPGSTGS